MSLQKVLYSCKEFQCIYKASICIDNRVYFVFIVPCVYYRLLSGIIKQLLQTKQGSLTDLQTLFFQMAIVNFIMKGN